ncbi:MltA domain-containing protein [Leptospira sp. WS92.C1]
MPLIFILFVFLLFGTNVSNAESLEKSGFIPIKEYPHYALQNLDSHSFQRALKESESYFQRLPSDWKFKIYEFSFDKSEFLNSIRTLKKLLKEKSLETRKSKFEKSFLFLESIHPQQLGKITGYYEVVLEGRLSPEGEYTFPVLEKPSDLIVKKRGNETVTGKILDGKFLPYEDRVELIAPSSWKNRTKSIVYMKLVDLHLAQLEGSALVNIPNQDQFRITYSSDNGKQYVSPATFLTGICKSLIPSKLRDCILEYPEEVRSAILKNPRYIFFKKEPYAPRGSGGIELIPQRSVAMDPGIPLGIPALLSFESSSMIEKDRIVFVHDRGSQIKGHGRLDYFLGTGKKAEEIAGKINTTGRIILILPKK